MGLLFLIVLGAILGWLTSIIFRAESHDGLSRNITAGIAGALLAGLLVSPLAGKGSLLGETYNVSALMLSLLGAILAIAGANLFKLRQSR